MARNVDIRLRRSAVAGNVPTIEQLNLGELAVNTADGKLYLKRQYDGIEQVIEVGGDARSGLVSTFNTYIYTSDGTLLTLSGADDYGNHLSYDLASPRRIQVYLNGVLLHQGIDYTATDGSSITFAFPIDVDQVVQVAAYNSDGASIDADLILDDGFSFTVGTDEETKFFHNGTDTILKHLGYNGGDFKIQYRDSDRIDVDSAGVNIFGDFRLNGESVITLADVINTINTEVDTEFVEALNISAASVSYVPDSDMIATNVQDAIDELHSTKLDITALSASIVLYPTSSTIAVDGIYTKMVTDINDSDYNTVAVDINTGNISGQNQHIASLATEQGVLIGNTGVINIHTVGNVRVNPAGSGGSATFYFEVYKRSDAGVETLLSTSSNTIEISLDTYVEFYADALLPATDFTATDRVVIKYYGNELTGNVNTTYDLQFGGTSPIRSNFPVPVSVIPQNVLEPLSGGSGIDYSSATGVISVDNTIATKTYSELYAHSAADSAASVALLAAKSYAEEQDSDTLVLAKSYASSNDAITLQSAKDYAESQDVINLQLAKDYTELYTDSAVLLTLNSANVYTDSSVSNIQLVLENYTDSAISAALITADASAVTYTDSAISIAISNLIDGAPQVLDTLNEISAALGDDSDFIGTVQNWINQKLDANATTDVIAEGVNNLYLTEERVRQSLSVSNGLSFNPSTGEFGIDSSDDVTFSSVTAATFVGNLQGNADTATDADQLDGQHGSYYRVNIYDINGTLVN